MDEIIKKRTPSRFDKTKREAYLEALRRGLRRGDAAKSVGMTRQGVYDVMEREPEFRREAEQAELDACELVEDALFKKALEGNTTAIVFWLLNRSPQRWQDKRQPTTIIKQDTMTPEEAKRLLKERGMD